LTKWVRLVEDEEKDTPETKSFVPPSSGPLGFETAIIPSSLMKADSYPFSSVIPKNIGLKTIRMRFTRSATLTTNGSGLMLLATQVGTLSSYAQSNISGLFSMFRLLSTQITYLKDDNSAGSAVLPQIFASGFDPVSNGSSPVAGDAQRQTNGKMISCNTTTTILLRNTYKFPKRPYSSVLSAGSGSDPVGTAGSWLHEFVIATTPSTAMLVYFIETWIELSNQR